MTSTTNRRSPASRSIREIRDIVFVSPPPVGSLNSVADTAHIPKITSRGTLACEITDCVSSRRGLCGQFS